MGPGNTDECLGLRLSQAIRKIPSTYPRVHCDDHGAESNQGENQDDKLKAGRNHQRTVHSSSYPDPLKTSHAEIRLLFQLAEAKASFWRDDGDPVRCEEGSLRKKIRDRRMV